MQQSINNNISNEDKWFEVFFSKYLSKAWTYLKNNSYYVMIINQKHKSEKYVNKMINYIYKQFSNSYYYGVISYANENKKNPQPIFIWKKSSSSIPEELYNPTIIIKSINYHNKSFNVIRDDMLIGGSKQRAIIPLLQSLSQSHNYNIYGYAGPVYGFGQIALAYGCYLMRKVCYIFVEQRKELHHLTRRAKSYGAIIIEVPNKLNTNNTPLHEVQAYANNYFDTKFNNLNNTKIAYMMPFGLETDEFIKSYIFL
jgi:hypothetical protein